jgi:hypothetical protein
VILVPVLGCGTTTADAFLAFHRDEDGSYAVEPVAIPELTDPVTMSGDLGTITHGGLFVGDIANPTYSGGTPLRVGFSTTDGVAIPGDTDGLMLFTFYSHLAAARRAVDERGVDVGPIFPMAGAWNAAADWSLEFSPSDNAAYATGANVFLLLPDGGARDVPLLANQGVIFHEFGHAVFHLLTTGDPSGPPAIDELDSAAANWQASLHEFFADASASLLLDDPRFLDASVSMPRRHVDADAAYTDDLDPADYAASADDLLAFYDPYPLGTVYASVSWDLRKAVGDPGRVYELLAQAAASWDYSAAFTGEEFWAHVVALADDEEGPILCAALEARSVEGVRGCS